MSKHKAIKSFFEPKVMELVGSHLGFNFSPESKDTISLLTNYAERILKAYITGDFQKEYGFTFLITKLYSTDDDDLNLEAMEFADAFSEWVNEQNEIKNFPDLGEKNEVEAIEVLQNMPNLAGINAEEGLAMYQVQARVIYREVNSI